MRRSPLRKQGQSETSKAKHRIQALLREIKIKEQGDCWVKLEGITEFGPCDEVFQYDHLETRSKNISYSDPRLGVLVCKRHHFYHGSPRREQRERYEELVRKFIGEKRAALWGRVRADGKAHPMGIFDWNKIIMALEQELRELS